MIEVFVFELYAEDKEHWNVRRAQKEWGGGGASTKHTYIITLFKEKNIQEKALCSVWSKLCTKYICKSELWWKSKKIMYDNWFTFQPLFEITSHGCQRVSSNRTVNFKQSFNGGGEKKHKKVAMLHIRISPAKSLLPAVLIPEQSCNCGLRSLPKAKPRWEC